jgi:hypothetical protein
MCWRWKRARARGEKKRPHVIQDHVRILQLWGLCDNCRSPPSFMVFVLFRAFNGAADYEKECIRCWVYGRWKH